VLRPLNRRLTRTERQEQTRQALLDAAARVFVNRGFQGSSVEEISAEAGYTRGAFYSNFSSKEELFVELLRDRVYTRYTSMTEDALRDPEHVPTLQQTGERLASFLAVPEDRWLWRLWFECLAQAGRDEKLRGMASTFWRGNRAGITRLIQGGAPELSGRAKSIATAMIALDIGLAIQHFVDPEDAPLELYPELYVLLFGPLLSGSDVEGPTAPSTRAGASRRRPSRPRARPPRSSPAPRSPADG
jgi:AcrR family transcriptional regulator